MSHTRGISMARGLKLKAVGMNFSLKDHIYEVLKDGIVGMNIYADDADLRLEERKMAEQLGISRTPIREALARLEQEGFVDIQPRKGVFIKRKSLEEVLEMITVWAALESMAARLVTVNASEAEIGSLRRMVADFNKNEARAHMDEYSEANIRFHQRILELSKCGMLKAIADGLFLHMRAIRARAMAEADRVSRSVVDHIHIIEALESRDADLACELVRDHTMRLHAHVRRSWADFTQSPRGKSGIAATTPAAS
ncbi:MAG: GntR family transcriptional regulator [Proteobacteria bacterium]|nr:GntR family transcriptional regulator [Pseudomonadota bacterium]